MVTTMLNEKRKFRLSQLALCTAAALFSHVSIANDLQITADVQTSAVFQDFAAENRDDSESASFTIEPRINALYEGRKFQGRWSGSYTYLERDLNDQSRTDNFGRYDYNAAWAPLDELLIFRVNGALNYQNVNFNGNLVNDFLLNEQELSKTRSNRYAIESNLLNNGYFNASGQVFFTDTKSERRSDIPNRGLDNDSVGANGSIRNDDSSKRLFWRAEGNYISTERGIENNNFDSRQAFAETSYLVINNWGITAIARHEANQIGNAITSLGFAREFNSYGAGITYRQSAGRVITLTANTVDTDFGDSDGDNFIGVDARWAFSERTALNATWGRRLFGDAGNVNFTYNTKHFRSALVYNEEITSFSRLISDPTNLGVFVCTSGSTELSNCFQPNSLNYQLQAGEEFRQFTAPNFQIEDDVFLRQNVTAQLGYRARRINMQFSVTYALDESLEVDRKRRTYNANASFSYQMNENTSFNAGVRFADTEQRGEQFVGAPLNETWNANFGFSRQLGRSLSANLRFSYVDRDSEGAVGFARNDLQNRRLTLSINYQIR